QVLLLADVTDYGDDLAAVVFLEPRNDDGGIQSSGVGEYHSVGLDQFCFHNSSLTFRCCQAGAQRCCAPTKKVRCDAMKSIAGLEQSMQDRFLHVHAVFGLIEDDRL